VRKAYVETCAKRAALACSGRASACRPGTRTCIRRKYADRRADGSGETPKLGTYLYVFGREAVHQPLHQPLCDAPRDAFCVWRDAPRDTPSISLGGRAGGGGPQAYRRGNMALVSTFRVGALELAVVSDGQLRLDVSAMFGP